MKSNILGMKFSGKSSETIRALRTSRLVSGISLRIFLRNMTRSTPLSTTARPRPTLLLRISPRPSLTPAFSSLLQSKACRPEKNNSKRSWLRTQSLLHSYSSTRGRWPCSTRGSRGTHTTLWMIRKSSPTRITSFQWVSGSSLWSLYSLDASVVLRRPNSPEQSNRTTIRVTSAHSTTTTTSPRPRFQCTAWTPWTWTNPSHAQLCMAS